MAFDAGFLTRRLAELAAGKLPQRYLVAFSGGLDSTVMLHALARARRPNSPPLLAIHVQHNLHADATNWARHCHDTARSLGVAYACTSVDVPRAGGSGIEAAAREARYAALAPFVRGGDWLLSAHHLNDQAETLLLNLLRGSGVDGLAGIGTLQPFGEGCLVRPLLQVSRSDLDAYATAHGLSWLQDPSNADSLFDRNFLRNDVLPRLAGRWPAAVPRLARSAALVGEASRLIAQLADLDLEAIGTPARLAVGPLLELPGERQRNVLRRALRRCGLPPAPEARLQEILESVLTAKEDATPLVRWPGAEVRRYRSRLYLQAQLPERGPAPVPALSLAHPAVDLGAAGVLTLAAGARFSLQQDLLRDGLHIRFRAGGERIRPLGHAHTYKLKKLLQEKAVVPWMRDRIPLLYSGESLVAVGDLWCAADSAADDGPGLVWLRRPEIF